MADAASQSSASSPLRTPSPSAPHQRFLRAARVVTSLIHVCKVCQQLMQRAVSAEDWYRMMDTYLDSSSSASSFQPQLGASRPFVTFVQDGGKHGGLTQLTFDKSEFARDCRADYLMDDALREMLKVAPADRTADQQTEIMRFMKKLSRDFSTYHVDTQRKLVECMYFDKYERNRVITRRGVQADGVYFIISGSLVEKTHDQKELKELKSGQRFGEKDIECGCARRTTVVTRTEVEIVTVHRIDYRSICNMADDSNNPKYLEVCKKDVVFQHFPLNKLIENPGVWTVLSYKFGRLMVKDSNELEWLYIIKSGEARVIKQLQADKINMVERHQQIQEKLDDQDPFHHTQTIIDFITAENTVQSAYKPGQYTPVVRNLRSAPPTLRRFLSKDPKSRPPPLTRASSRLSELVKEDSRLSSATAPQKPLRAKSARVDPMMQRIQADRELTKARCGSTVITSPKMWSENRMGILDKKTETSSETGDATDPQNVKETTQVQDSRPTCADSTSKTKAKHRVRIAEQGGRHDGGMVNGRRQSRAEVIQTGMVAAEESKEQENGKMVDVPPFVQLETLHTGMVFGMRACLGEEERGPSASLVSAGCEVLQINKKYFLMNVDDALISLIKLKHKPYPSEEDLLDRLDVNFQWNEFKHKTVDGFIRKMQKKKGKVH